MNLISNQTRMPVRSTSWTCRIVRDAQELESLREPWLDLLRRSAMNELMLTPLWLFNWWNIYGEDKGSDLRVGLFYDGDRLMGIAPFYSRRCWYRPGICFRRLEPLGADVDEQDGVCSDYLNVICDKGTEPQMAKALVEQLQNGAFGRWDELIVPAMDGDGVMPKLLVDAFCDAGFAASCEETGAAPYIPLGTSWDAYLKAMSQRYRYQLRRSLKQFDKWAGEDVQYRRVETHEDLDEGKRILMQLHQERWQDAGEQGVFSATRFQRFHDLLMPQLLVADALELVWITVRGEPIAVDYSFVWNGKQYVYQGGRKMDVPQGQRPGVVIAAHGIENAIRRGLREFDFLAGEALYKKQLALATRPIVTFRAVRSAWKERVRRLGEWGAGCVRAIRNRLRRAKD